jgi:hypothetical protein
MQICLRGHRRRLARRLACRVARRVNWLQTSYDYGYNVVCIMPTKDSPNNITALTAAAIAFEMISMIAETVTP